MDGGGGSHARNSTLSGGAVVGKVVDGAAGNAAERVPGGEGLDARAERGGGLVALEGQEVGAETGDVRRGHRGAGDGVLCR